ncbi:hypothetical protein MPC4_170010 [Methylocella tundrae]|uniref:Uncharacterized protein n=1 Tax=Methylocella tundrae TaxID=227605 RepID=A0A8B6M3S4_METTU|nr:hypothetical protein [Methylocella tundrae]VTZ23112.1 hypothetical protein MPC1_13650003 [Methylocella tundrae]VTZ49478.1 hypothetical protein MPC4_170010 [Methylocella tundrae]
MPTFYDPPQSPIGVTLAPRRFITDFVVIDELMKLDILEIFASAGVVYFEDLLRRGWMRSQLDAFKARQLARTRS